MAAPRAAKPRLVGVPAQVQHGSLGTCAGGSWRCYAALRPTVPLRDAACRPVGPIWFRVLQRVAALPESLSSSGTLSLPQEEHGSFDPASQFSPPKNSGCSCIVPSSPEGKTGRRIQAHMSHTYCKIHLRRVREFPIYSLSLALYYDGTKSSHLCIPSVLFITSHIL
jgi:hypothetical protein